LFRFFVSDPRGLDHMQSMSKRKLLDRREGDFVAAAGWFIRLRPHRYDFMTILNTLPQRRNGSLRCAHEDNSHRNQFSHKKAQKAQTNLNSSFGPFVPFCG
jgi:hypothetical protein